MLNALYMDVYRYAFWICKNRDGAEGLVQEAYYQAWNKLADLKNDKAAKVWLFSIVRAENTRKQECYKPEELEVNEMVISDPKISAAEHSEYGVIQNYIAALEIEIREPLILQLVGGFDAQEISSILSVSKNTVLTRLYRARKRLKMLLDQTNIKSAING